MKGDTLTRYVCGHVGMMTGKKEPGFVRWAEVRNHKPVESKEKCPNCGKSRPE